MSRVALLKGSYQARSIIADAQASINLYSETNPDDQQTPITLYPTPGLTTLATPPVAGPIRAQYRATNGDFYRVVGPNIYYVDATWAHHHLGTMLSTTGIVGVCDNTLAVVFVDNTVQGYAVDMVSHNFGTISSPYFFGSTGIGCCDTYLVFNQPETNGWYISLSNANFNMLTGPYGGVLSGSITDAGSGGTDGLYTGVALTGGSGTGAIASITVLGGAITQVAITTPGLGYQLNDVLSATFASVTGFAFTVGTAYGIAFDPLAYATKSGTGDLIQNIIVVHNETWLVGQSTTEVWYDAGNADFAFARLPGVFIEKGTAAPFSLCKHNETVYFVAQDRDGSLEIVQGQNYQVSRISTNAIDNAMIKYPTVTDAIGYCYEQEGHSFVVMNFPSANVTWVYDIGERQWHQRAYTDSNGVLNRHKGLCGVYVNQTNTVGDYLTGLLYKFDLNSYTDNGDPITRLRRFPHSMNDMKRVTNSSFVIDMEVGTDDGSVDGTSSINEPMIYLSWSDDRGKTYGNKVGRSLGSGGNYVVSPKWTRLGLARDRVYQIDWSIPTKTALQGAFVERISAGT